MLEALRLTLLVATIVLVSSALALALRARSVPPGVRFVTPALGALLVASYVAALVCGAALVGDLAESHAEFRWYASPLLAVSVLTGWAAVILGIRRARAAGRRPIP